MGIRVFCPNGHRLNLKSHLAGKQGICPHCGMTVAIPSLEKAEELGMLKNPREAAREKVAAGYAAADVLYEGHPMTITIGGPESGGVAGADPSASCEPSLASPYARSNGSAGNGSAGNGSGTAAHQEDRAAERLDDGGIEIPLKTDASAALAKRTPSTADASAAVAEPVPSSAPATAEIDPIDENPQAVWYVRTPQGGQYGPAAGDIMRKWIAEGRVQADFWVWREGWADWQKASASIPSLRAGAVAAPMAPSVGGTSSSATNSSAASAVASPARAASVAAPSKSGEPSAYAASDASPTPRVARTRRRGIHPLAILAVVGLGLVCLALFGVLVAMLAGVI